MRCIFISFFILAGTIRATAQDRQVLRDGDIIFIVNPSGQGKSIQLATKSKYTHVGIFFIENGVPVVYHAVEPVSRNTLREFISMSADGNYVVRRLKDQSMLTAGVVKKMREQAVSRLGTHYDYAFDWDDEKLYCSEFVWKLYSNTLSISVGSPRALREFDLSHPAVKAALRERYGDETPLGEQMISPGDMFNSSLLE